MAKMKYFHFYLDPGSGENTCYFPIWHHPKEERIVGFSCEYEDDPWYFKTSFEPGTSVWPDEEIISVNKAFNIRGLIIAVFGDMK